MTRTDIHRPSFLDPAEYREVASFDNHPEEGGVWWSDKSCEGYSYFSGNYERSGRCDHCGAGPLRYGVIFLHEPTNTMVTVGERCARVLDLSSKTERQRRDEHQAARRRAERDAWVAENQDIGEFLDIVRQAEADYRDAMQAANEQFEVEYEAAYKAGTRLPRFRAPKAPETSHPFLTDMVHTLNRHGKLSEAQAAATRKFIASAKERAENPKPVEPEPETPLAEGRYEIVGEIVSHRWQESGDYGSTHKCLIKLDDGNKVWGTIPAAIEDALTSWNDETGSVYEDPKGHRLSLTATVTRSDDDEHFGFYKRPTGSKLITPTNEKEA